MRLFEADVVLDTLDTRVEDDRVLVDFRLLTAEVSELLLEVVVLIGVVVDVLFEVLLDVRNVLEHLLQHFIRNLFLLVLKRHELTAQNLHLLLVFRKTLLSIAHAGFDGLDLGLDRHLRSLESASLVRRQLGMLIVLVVCHVCETSNIYSEIIILRFPSDELIMN